MDIENYKSPRIIALEIDEFDEDSGVDGIALVEQPAIESDWIYFSSQKQIFESYNDYPQEASDNACKVLRWIDEYGRDEVAGMTQVGLARANQLCNKENISEETIARMSAFARHKKNSEIDEEYKGTPWKDKGYVAWLGWGGDAGVNWAQRKLKSIREELAIDVADIGDYIPTGSDIIPKDTFDVEDYLGFYFELVDYIDGLPLFTTKEEAEKVADMIECEGIHEHTIEGFTFYMPCSDHDEATQSFLEEVEALLKKKKKKYAEELPQEQEDVVIEYLSRVGESEEDLVKAGWVRIDDAQEFAISSTPDQPSIDDVNDRIYRYEYANKTGGKATTQTDSRDFCIRIVRLNKLYRKEDINQMTLSGENSQFAQKGSFTYDIFKYAGGKYCKHKWNKVAYKKSNIKEKKQNQIEQTEFAKIKFETNEKQLIAGPLMIPRKLIYRFDEHNGEYWVYFTESVIERISHKYLMNKNQDQTNLEHSESIKLEDVVLVESWLVEDPEKDKSFALTGKTYEKGTWFGIMKVKNLSVWEEWVKTGRVKGYSVEGYFSDKLINMSKTKFYYRTTEGGDEIVIDHKTSVVFILKDGERKAILPDGTYELNNGKSLKVINSKAVEDSF